MVDRERVQKCGHDPEQCEENGEARGERSC